MGWDVSKLNISTERELTKKKTADNTREKVNAPFSKDMLEGLSEGGRKGGQIRPMTQTTKKNGPSPRRNKLNSEDGL